VFFSPYPWDVRVEKIARSLVTAGHDLTLLCRNDRLQPTREQIDGIEVMRLRPLRIAPDLLNRMWNAPLPVNPVWWLHIASALRSVRPDLVLVRDIPLAVPCALLARRSGIPTVLDMAENYPAAIAEWLRWEHCGPLRRLERNVTLARCLERMAVALADHILVVADEQRQRLVQMGVSPGLISIVGNTPELGVSPGQNPELNDSLRRRFHGRTVMFYFGELHLHRGIDVAIRATAILHRTGNQPLLVLAGRGVHEQSLRRLAAEAGVEDHVSFEGWVEPHLLPLYIANVDVALVPHHTSEHTNTTLPNKLFEYMAHCKPVVVSDAAPLARVVRTEGCGVVFRSGNAMSLADAVLQASDTHSGPLMGACGREAVLRRYNWSADRRRLCLALDSVGTRADSPNPGGTTPRRHLPEYGPAAPDTGRDGT